jgi:glutamate-1-semialdehyde 2,1-aminomutase
MFCTYFCGGPVKSFEDASKSDTEAFSRYFCAMLDQGINLAPSQFEAGFMSIAHTREDLDQTIEAAEKAFKAL